MNGPLITPPLEKRCKHTTVVEVHTESEEGISYNVGHCAYCKERIFLSPEYGQDGTPTTYVRKSKD